MIDYDKIKTKYKVGEEVWACLRKMPVLLEIKEIKPNTIPPLYRIKTDENICMLENELYASREALINAQIEYWQSLKDNNNE
jgi:hypothetical protein